MDAEEFCTFVHETWRNMNVDNEFSPLNRIVKKLNLLKIEVRKWEKNRKVENEKELDTIDEEFQRLSREVDDAFFSTGRK